MKIGHVAMDFLETLAREERPMRSIELEVESGHYVSGTPYRVLEQLIELGAVYKPYWGLCGITERGKIALAIQTGINARKRARIKASAA